MFIGVVGKANVGKSTFFKAATLAEVEIANYPFTTIKPNHAVGYVKVECADKEFNKQCNPRVGYCIKGIRFVPIDLMDVAGLVPGAHKGYGMGNQFLDDLRQADALIHVVDISGSTNEKGDPVEALSYNPEEDIRFLEIELDMWYHGILKKGWERFARQVVQEKGDIKKALAKQLSALKVTEEMVEECINKLNLDQSTPTKWTDDDLLKLASELRKKTKPMIIAANKIDVKGADKNLERIKKIFNEYIIVPCSAESELALREAARKGLIDYTPGKDNFIIKDNTRINEKQKKALEFIKENILKKYGSTGVQEVLDKTIYELLGLIAVYPVAGSNLCDKDGNVMPDCFLVKKECTALDFAFKVHTDIGKNFIRAIDMKTKKTIGKEHRLKHRDVIEIIVSR